MARPHNKYFFMLIFCASSSYLFFCCADGAPIAAAPAADASSCSSPSHYVLIHGAGFGAWSWFKVIPLLRLSGDRVTALDLAASGINTQQADNLLSVADYFQPLVDFMVALPSNERVVLVAQGYGGLAVTYTMELFPEKIAVAVFISALMPGPTLSATTVNREGFASLDGVLDSIYSYHNGSNNPPTSLLFGPILLSTKLLHYSPEDDYVLTTLLIRYFPLFTDEDLARVIRLTRRRYGSLKRVFIVSGQNRALNVSFQESMIRRNPPDEVIRMTNSDHTVIFSRPTELSAHLLGVARRYS